MIEQKPVSGRPICTKCMHGHQVETITGRENTPTEYHCGFCGNYAIVGVPARWPFMEVVKSGLDYSENIHKSSKPSENGSGGRPQVDEKSAAPSGSSPMQVGESLVKSRVNYSKEYSKIGATGRHAEKKTAKQCKPEKEKKMGKPKCIIEGCEKLLAAVHLCEDHFREQYGITVEEYKANKRHRTETPAMVAARLKGEKPVAKKEKHPAKPPTPPVTGIPTTGKDEETQLEFEAPVPARAILIPPEMYERIEAMAEAEFRTPDLQVRYLLHKGMEADKAVRG